MPTSYGTPAILGLVVAMGVVTFAIRVSFIALFGRFDEIPPRVQRALYYVPAAVLAALVLPSIVPLGTDAGGLPADKLLAGGVAAAVAWRTDRVVATLAAGMATLWIVRFLA